MRDIETVSGVSGVWRSDEEDRGSECASRSGVALIIVLGLLVLMMVLCVTFAIYMRTERVAAANYAKDVVVRQLAYAAISRAMAAIDANMDGRAYPEWDVLVSGGTDPVNSVTNAPAADWIPQAVWPSARNPLVVRVNGGTTTVATAFAPQWFRVENFNNTDYRVGYAVFDCSGLLDANYAGGTNRSIGASAAEIQISNLGEIGTAANATALVNNRPYETGQELTVVGRPAGYNFIRGYPSNFVAYSAAPHGLWDAASGTVRTNIVDISGDATALSNRRPAIVAALMSSVPGASQSDADSIFENLLDYVDSDNIPHNLASPDTELVPMINEVQLKVDLQFDQDAGLCTPWVKLRVEWFYPFSKPTANDFELEYDITFSSFGDFPAPANVSGTCGIEFQPNVDRNRIWVNESAGTDWAAPSFNYPTNGSVAYGAAVKLRIRNAGTTNVVDEVPSPWTEFPIALQPPAITVPATVPAEPPTAVDGTECNDPRFNWDVFGANPQWFSVGTNGSMGFPNNTAQSYWANDPSSDGHGYMHVADQPLRTVGELTYLSRGKNDNVISIWTTIRLARSRADDPVDPVLDYFTTASGTVAVAKGFVNPNTQQKNALTAVLRDTPLDTYPGELGATGLRGALLGSVADQWLAFTDNSPVWNLSELGNMTNIFSLAGISTLSPLQQEAWLRNTAGLLNSRQQYFLILAFVETSRYVVQIGTTRLGRQRVLAEVWRDPYPAPDGHHPTLVRMVRILNEE